MTKIEFIRTLTEKLYEGMPRAQVLSHARYYEGYIDGEMARGKTQEEAVADLGDPLLIARNLLDSPQQTGSFFGTLVQDQEDAYAEGTYQGENHHSDEEVKAAAKDESVLSDNVPDEDDGADKPQTEESGMEDPSSDPTAGTDAQPGDDEDDRGDEGREEQRAVGSFPEEKGAFRWDLAAAAIAFIIGLTAVIWLIGKLFRALGPAGIVILAAVFAAYFIYHLRR